MGIGLNMKKAPKGFDKLDVEAKSVDILTNYFSLVEKRVLWKEIFSKYKIEFHKAKNMEVTIKGRKVFLKDAILLEDGSIEMNGERIYSLR